jgi:hypothetical protein
MAAQNKCLAENNKTRTADKATIDQALFALPGGLKTTDM